MTEQLRPISRQRLIRRYGVVTNKNMQQVEHFLRMLLNL